MRPSLNLESMADSSPVESIMANLCASGREWFEVVGEAWRQDRLTSASPTTGMPLSLPPNVKARTVIPIMAAGTYVCAWDGSATVSVQLLGAVGSGVSAEGGEGFDEATRHDLPFAPSIEEHFAGSSMSEYLAAQSAPPGGPAFAGSGRFTFTHDGTRRQAFVTISDIGTSDPPANLRVCRIEDEAGWQGLSSEFLARMAILRPQCIRLLDIMEPNSTRDTLETWAQRRPNTWWTQSNVYLDVFTVPAAAWVGTAPALGDTITWSGGSGAWVRTGSPVAGVLGHVKLSGQHLTSGVVTCTRTGATATLTAAMAPWQPRIQGPSELWLRDFAAAMMPLGLTHLWLTLHYGTVDDYHTQLATVFKNDARLAGLKVVPEFGNESWNSAGSFSVGFNYCNEQGTALEMPGAAPHEKGGQFYAHRQRQIHNLWRAVYVGRETEIPRVFCGHNRSHEYWFRWRTIINPNNDGAFPLWPQEVLPIDAWAVAPYIGNMENAPQNAASWWAGASATDQAILDYLVNTELPIYVTGVPTGSYPDRQGGFRLFSVLTAERGCELWVYETNFHLYQLSGAQGPAMTARVTAWMRTAYCAEAFRQLLLALQTYASAGACVCVYNSSRAWGSSGWWGILENPYDGTVDDVRWQVLTTFAGNDIIEATFEEADVYMLARATNWQIVGAPNLIEARSQRATISTAASSTNTEVIGTETVIAKGSSAEMSVAAAETSWELEGDIEIKSEGSVLVMHAGETIAFVDIPIIDEIEAHSEAATISTAASSTTTSRDVWEVSSGAATATIAAVATRAAVMSPDGGGGIGRRWVLNRIANAPKSQGIELPRGSLLSWESAGPSVPTVAPLRGGRKFAGIAAAHAEPHELVASISRAGILDVEIEDIPEERDFVVVAIDDQRLYSEKGASAAGLAYTVIGKGFYHGSGICSVAYYAEGHR